MTFVDSEQNDALQVGKKDVNWEMICFGRKQVMNMHKIIKVAVRCQMPGA